jgi:hypothetical protein
MRLVVMFLVVLVGSVGVSACHVDANGNIVSDPGDSGTVFCTLFPSSYYCKPLHL